MKKTVISNQELVDAINSGKPYAHLLNVEKPDPVCIEDSNIQRKVDSLTSNSLMSTVDITMQFDPSTSVIPCKYFECVSFLEDRSQNSNGIQQIPQKCPQQSVEMSTVDIAPYNVDIKEKTQFLTDEIKQLIRAEAQKTSYLIVATKYGVSKSYVSKLASTNA